MRTVTIEKVNGEYQVNPNATSGSLSGVWGLRANGYDGETFLVVPQGSVITDAQISMDDSGSDYSSYSFETPDFTFNGGDYYIIKDYYCYKFTIDSNYVIEPSLRTSSPDQLLSEILPAD